MSNDISSCISGCYSIQIKIIYTKKKKKEEADEKG